MIIGIQVGITSGVAVYEDGKIIFAASEERYSRIKNDSNWPSRAIDNAKKLCNITEEKIEKICLVSQKMTPVHFLCNIGGYSIEDYIKEQNEYYKPTLLQGKELNYLDVFCERTEKTLYRDLYARIRNNPKQSWAQIWNEWRIEKVVEAFGCDIEKVIIMNHEYSHASYGLYGSWYTDYSNVMCVVYDGFGDDSNASVWVVEEGKLKKINQYSNFNVGRLYRYITLLLGMKPNEHEFKVMGLAPYCSEYIYRKPLEVFRKAYKFDNGEIIVDPEVKDNYFYFKERLEGMRFDGIAAALQILTEELNCQLIEYWQKKTGKKKVVISGGVALNIKSNMKIGQLDAIEDIFVVGSSGDESQCVGAIYSYLDSVGRSSEIRPIDNLYLGGAITKKDIENVIYGIDLEKYEVMSNPTARDIAQKISEGLILGRAVGRMEFGARALGNRSILADPRKRETIDRINAKIKSRDFWMPFTPSILFEEKDRFLDNPKNIQYPFMAISCDTTEDGKKYLQAAIHPADKTARPQLVTPEMNKKYYDLIKAFKDITGVGALLNTSLNLHGYPIVSTAEEAFYVLDNSDLDGLILDGYLIIKVGADVC